MSDSEPTKKGIHIFAEWLITGIQQIAGAYLFIYLAVEEKAALKCPPIQTHVSLFCTEAVLVVSPITKDHPSASYQCLSHNPFQN